MRPFLPLDHCDHQEQYDFGWASGQLRRCYTCSSAPSARGDLIEEERVSVTVTVSMFLATTPHYTSVREVFSITWQVEDFKAR